MKKFRDIITQENMKIKPGDRKGHDPECLLNFPVNRYRITEMTKAEFVQIICMGKRLLDLFNR